MAGHDCAVLGYGTIGAMITALLLKEGTAQSITVANRTPRLTPMPPGVKTADFATAAREAGVVFLCVKPQACLEVLGPLSSNRSLLVSTAADVSDAALRTQWSGPVVRMMPVVTSAWGRGTTLLAKTAETDPEALALVQGLFPDLKFLTVAEEHWNAVSAITSCGPGLMAAWLNQFALSSPPTGLEPKVVEDLVLEAMAGVQAWRTSEGQPLSTLLQAVATPGGVTGEGAKVLEAALPPVFETMHQAMERRHSDRAALVEASFKTGR